MTTDPQNSSLSARGSGLIAGGALADKWKAILGDSYDAEKNPNGIVNMGTSENYLMLDKPAKFAKEHFQLETKDFSYGHGAWASPRMRNAMAKHMTRHFHPLYPFEPNNFVFANGVTALCEMLGFSIFDEGDAILLSRPIYHAFTVDFGTKAKVNCRFVPFGDMDQFSSAAVKKYEEAIQESQRTGGNIKALLLCHPHNPLGRCYTEEALIGYMKLCDKYKIHLLMDEIYALSVFDIPDPKATRFKSISTFDTDKYINPNYLHLLYGLSKDNAAGGMRLGCLYTKNADLRQALGSISMFHWSGNVTERLAIAMLENEEWMDDFLMLSCAKLAKRNLMVRKMLDNEGIKYYPGANAGFFLWLDLRAFLPEVSGSGDGDRWDREAALTKQLFENKVYITEGKALNAEEPGWYRLIFSQDEKVLQEGFRRQAHCLTQ